MSSAALLSEYLLWLQAARRYSPLTVASYRRDLTQLLDLLGETPLAEVSSAHIRRCVAQLHRLSARSLARHLSSWRGFFAYWMQEHGGTHNPCLGLHPPKAARTLPHALSPDEAVRLVEFATPSPLAVRDRAMFELFYSSGLRLAELVALDAGQLDLRQGEVRVHGKGNKSRIVPLGRVAVSALRDWLRVRHELAQEDETALFVGARGRRIAPRVVQLQLAKRAVQAGLPQHVHPHMLRHSFASHVLQSSGDLRAVQEMLGHASLRSTQVYTHLDFQHLSQVYDAAHPRAKNKPQEEK